jgi:signal transduction histidine kinase
MIGVLSVLILILICILISYKRQVKDICRQLRFLQECDSNMLITTEMKKGHIEELAELLNTLLKERKKERADYQKKERMIADIYTNLSHDIRTPLTSLDGYFQLLEETQEENDRKRYIQIIQERIESLKEMLEELFTYTKLQNGTYELKLEPQNVGQILKETVFSYYDDWAEQGISPQFEITEEPVWIRGNKQALRRTIQNIIRNGLDHGNKEIRIQLSRNEKQMELVFQNKIEPGEQIDISRVFERFYKADKARSKSSTGLGLSIAKGFVQKMHGEIAAEIKEDWFCIKISFPCETCLSD